MVRTKVRFNLARGKNYKKWKITYPGGITEYLDPSEVTLVMSKCKLNNNRKVAEKIFGGKSKEVCAWVLCEYLVITDKEQTPMEESQRLRFNPRVKPNWDFKNVNADGKEYRCIESRGSRLYVNY